MREIWKACVAAAVAPLVGTSEVVHTRKTIKLNNRYKFWQKPQVVDSRARAVSRLFVEFLSFQSFRVAVVYI